MSLAYEHAANLAQALDAAKAAREAEVAALANMSEQEIAYLAGVGTLEDPVTDGIGCDREDDA